MAVLVCTMCMPGAAEARDDTGSPSAGVTDHWKPLPGAGAGAEQLVFFFLSYTLFIILWTENR